jgi:hypothetical protein
MIGDPQDLRRLAQVASALADQAREQAAVVLSTGGVEWRSSAADRFRDGLVDLARALRCNASRLDEASLALWAHARAAESEITHLFKVLL